MTEPLPNRAQVRDTELARGLRAGDEVALGLAFDLYAATAWRVLARLLNSNADADDALQDLFVGLSEAISSYVGRGSLEAWIRRVAVRTALMRLRTARRRAETPIESMPAVQEGRGTSNPPIELRIALADALAALPNDLRTVFILKEIEGYSHAEISRAVGISVTLSEVRLFRARGRLRALLGDCR